VNKQVDDIDKVLSELVEEMKSVKQTVSEQGAEINRLHRVIDQKDKTIHDLKKRLSKYEEPPKDSHNSSVPPSQDPIGKKALRRTKSLREKSGKASGGQPGHEGHCLETSAEPDVTVQHSPSFCQCCGMPLDQVEPELLEKSQVIDIPPVKPVVTEHQSYGKRCKCGHLNICTLPKECRGRVSYGKMVNTVVAYLGHVQCISFKRICETLKELFNLSVSEGTVQNILKRLGEKSQSVYDEIRNRIEQAGVVGADETGEFVNKELHWAWTFQTPTMTYVFQDKSRGKRAVNRHFPNDLPNAVLITDRHSAYFTMDVKGHQVCIPHLLRNIQYLDELNKDQKWTGRLMKLLRDAIHLKKTSEWKDITQDVVKGFYERLDRLLSINLNNLHKDFNSLKKGLAKCRDYIFTFLTNPEVPYDNNASERAIRKIKVKQKVSGCFRTNDGADIFMKLHSIAETAMKNGNSKFKALLAVVEQ